jgi:hypothetical protein
MSPKNIKKINSKVSYHWSPKRRREMQVEADIMTGYYGYGFIYDIVRDVTLRRLSYDEGRRHLLKHGFELKKNEPTSTEKFRASPLRRGDRTEVYQESPITDNKRTLLKELNLGKDLLNKAAKNITESTLLDISSDNNITWADQQLIRSFISVLELINNGRVEYYPDWAVIQSELKSTNFWLTKVDNLEYMIDEYAFSYYKIDELKQNFTRLAPDSSNKAYVATIREFLLEAFCLIDIVEELRGYSKLRSSSYYTYDSTVDRIVREHSSPKIQVEIQEQKEPEQINETKEKEIKQNDTIKEEIDESSPAVQQEAAQVEVENTDQEIRHVTKKEVEEPRIEIKSPMSSPIEREIRHNIVQSRSTRKKITTKSYKKGGKVVKETTTTYFSPNSRAKATVIEKKVKVKKAASPTRRIIDMKNSSLKHKQNAANVKGASGKMLYTLDPKNAYLVTNEYPQGTSREEIVRKTLDGKHGFAEDFIDEDGKITTKYYFTSPHAQKVKSNGRVEEVHREIIESPTRRLWVQEWQDEPIVRDILSPVNFESRRDFIKRIEERTKNINDDITYHNGSFDREYVRHEDRSERYHKLLRDTLSYN